MDVEQEVAGLKEEITTMKQELLWLHSQMGNVRAKLALGAIGHINPSLDLLSSGDLVGDLEGTISIPEDEILTGTISVERLSLAQSNLFERIGVIEKREIRNVYQLLDVLRSLIKNKYPEHCFFVFLGFYIGNSSLNVPVEPVDSSNLSFFLTMLDNVRVFIFPHFK